MKFLLLNQTFYPDVAATAQYLADLALGLAGKGHEVTVITSRRAYDAPRTRFAAQEFWQGIRILRVASTGFGKRTKWGRAIDAVSFFFFCTARLLTIGRVEVVVVLTSPPLISFVAAVVGILRRWKTCCWVMDFNPDEAIAIGWLKADSLGARLLTRICAFSLKRCAKIIALDRFMRERIVARGVPPDRVVVLPLWSQDNHVRYDLKGRQRFRAEHGLEGKFVVMYSGNHSPCHPLDSLLSAAEFLRGEKDISFCFIGGGTEWRKLRKSHTNVRFLPYQPLAGLSASLSAADLHVVVMGEQFVGVVHPCKPYNLLKIGAPMLYIGPPQSHITELLEGTASGKGLLLNARHGEVKHIVELIRDARANQEACTRPEPVLNGAWCQARILPQLIAELEMAATAQ